MRSCPDKSALIIKGEHFPCDAMSGMTEDSKNHDGWPHSNRNAEAVWSSAFLTPADKAVNMVE